MQAAYTGFFSGAESVHLPQEARDKRQELEAAFTQMQTLATQLAGFQQAISKAIADQKPPATTWAGVVSSSAGSSGATVPGGATVAAGVGNEGPQASLLAEGVQTVEQNVLQSPPAAVAAAARTTSRTAEREEKATTRPPRAQWKPNHRQKKGLRIARMKNYKQGDPSPKS